MRIKKTFFFADPGDYLYTYDKKNQKVCKTVIKGCNSISTRVRVYQTKLGTFSVDFTNSHYYTDFGDMVVAVSKDGLRRWVEETKCSLLLGAICDAEFLINTYY